MQRALDRQLTDPHASARAFAELDHDLVDLAPLVPFGTGIQIWLVSERASNVEVSPQLGVLVSRSGEGAERHLSRVTAGTEAAVGLAQDPRDGRPARDGGRG
jgi:hypothetical protein